MKQAIRRDISIERIALTRGPAQDPARIVIAKAKQSGSVAPDMACAECGAACTADSPCPECGSPAKADKAVAKRSFTAEDRKKYAASGEAMPDGSFPIVNAGDLSNAIQSFGRAGSPAPVARHIKQRARALGRTDLLPDSGLLAKSQPGDDPMADTKLEQVQADLAKATARAERAEKVAELSAAELALFKSLDKAGQDSFLALDAAGRAAELAKAKDADPVVYLCKATGASYRKSSPPNEVALAKALDASNAKAEAHSEALAKANLRARAEELKFHPGTVEERVELLKAIDAIPDAATRDRQLAIVKSINADLAKAFERAGSNGPARTGSPEQKYEELAKARATKDGCSLAVAKMRVQETPEGRELVEQMRAEQAALVGAR